MAQFWNEQLAVEPDGEGLAAALPLMYPDGWQIVVAIEPFSATHVMISDRGRTLQMLEQGGLRLDSRSRQNHALLEERKRVFELDQNGFELRRLLPLPLSGLDIQLFAESLVSISHLAYRNESRMPQAGSVRQSLERTFSLSNLHPSTGHTLAGRVESNIRVDYWFEDKQRLALNCVEVRERFRLRDYMERWAWRWTDVRNHDPDILTAMVYDPDNQDWDDMSLAIGRDVCTFFAPVHDRQQIIEQLRNLKVA